MYELNRVRLVGIGPRGARYSDVTLDLSGVGQTVPARTLIDPAVRRPSPYTLLMLENGGGKSVLLKLIFSVILPGRRRTIGGGNLDNFLLSGDTGHVALEWMHVTTGEQLVTAKAVQHRSRTGSNSSPFTEAWYSFRPTDEVDLSTLPVVEDGRRRRLDGYRDALETALKSTPAAQLSWLGDDQGRWRDHLRSNGVEPDLFDIQRSMNVDEGDAANAFKFTSSKAFIDWLLRTVTDPADAASVAETFEQWATTVANRAQMMLEADFLEGAIAGLGPLAEAHADHQAAARAAKGATDSAGSLAQAIAARADAEDAHTEQLSGELAAARQAVQERASGRDRARDRLNEVRLTTLRLELKGARDEAAAIDEQIATAERHVTAWELVPAVHEVAEVQAAADALAAQVAAQDENAAPALARRDEAASRLLARFDFEAAAAETAARTADDQAADIDEQQQLADAEVQGQRERAGALAAKIDNARETIRRAGDDIATAVSAGLVPVGTRADAVDGLASQAKREAETRADDVRRAKEAMAAREGELAVATGQQPSVVNARAQAARSADQAHDVLEAMLREGRRLAQIDLIADAASDDAAETLTVADLHGCADAITAHLRTDAEAHTTALDALRRAQDDDLRVLTALGDGGLLPCRGEVDAVLGALRQASIPAHSGWAYLAETVAADRRADLIAAHPALADGVIIADALMLSRAREVLTGARILPPAAIAVGTGRSLLSETAGASPWSWPAEIVTNGGDDAERGFVVEASPAMYDQDAAEERRHKIVASMEGRAPTIADTTGQLDAVQGALSDLAAWRRTYPAGTLGRLTDADERAVAALAAATETLNQLEELVANLTERRDTARTLLEEASTRERTASDRAHHLRTLAAKVESAREAGAQLPDLLQQHQLSKDAADGAHRLREEHQSAATRARTLAEQHRAQARALRAEASEVPASTPTRAPTVPDQPLAALRQQARAAHDVYLAAAANQDLRDRAERASDRARSLGQQLTMRDPAVVDEARGLLASAAGASRAGWDAHLRNARADLTRLRGRSRDITLKVGSLEHAVSNAQPGEPDRKAWIVLEPQWVPTSVDHGHTLARELEEHQQKAQAELDAAAAHVATLDDAHNQASRFRDAFRAAFSPLKAVLNLTDASSSRSDDLGPYPGTALDADADAASAIDALHRTGQALDKASRTLTKTSADLKDFVNLPHFEAMTNPVRRAISGSSLDQLGVRAAHWAEQLEARHATLRLDLENASQHRKVIIDRLSALVVEALRTLRTASRLSKLPGDLGDWAGRTFLRITFSEPDLSTIVLRVGDVVDTVAAEMAGRVTSGRSRNATRDGLTLLLEAVHAAVPKGFTVEVLKPDSVLRDERVSIEDMAQVFSGGQELTAAIILYCTLAALRANERGQMRAKHSGVLFLDNPIGKANASYLLDLQQSVARSLGVQLIYTTGLSDDRVLAAFPLWVRLRNDADLRAGLKYIRVADVMRERLPDPYPDDELALAAHSNSAPGTVTATRVFIRPEKRRQP